MLSSLRELLLGYLFFHPPHQPGFAGLTRCPDSKVMTALFGNSDQLLNALSNQVRAADTKMVAAIHRTVRMKMSHIGNQGGGSYFVVPTRRDGRHNEAVQRSGCYKYFVCGYIKRNQSEGNLYAVNIFRTSLR